MKVIELIKEIQNTPGSNSKKALLKEHMSEIVFNIFNDTYGPQKYYIKKIEKPDKSGPLNIEENYQEFQKVLHKLANREFTGNEAYQYLYNTIEEYDEESQEILMRIIDRNLKIGVSLDNFLEVLGSRNQKFEVALAESLDKAKGVDPIGGNYFISRKLDGVRCICKINRGVDYCEVSFYSRQGKPIQTLSNLEHHIKLFTEPLGIGEYVLDGEVCLVDDYGRESFHGLMKEITKKNHTIKNPKYNIFDILTQPEFDGEVSSPNFSERCTYLNNLFESFPHPSLEVIEQERVTSQEVMDKWINRARKDGWEGCMLRKDAPYKRGRSKDLLKIKEFKCNDYKVIGVVNGKATYNEDGSKEYDVVSALVISHKNNEVFVGSGLSKEQRLRWFEHPEEILNMMIRVKFFEETKDSKTGLPSLRFPILDYVYGTERFDGDEESYLE